MSHGYTLRLRDLNRRADSRNVGVRLGKLCIKHGVPVTAVAQRMGVSRATVYNWFCGATAPQDYTVPSIEAFIAEFG
jgi:transcriptional regulator with XRE-family HTH domain